jgi:pimeloyl-ACP methyl ester carboxylesterase
VAGFSLAAATAARTSGPLCEPNRAGERFESTIRFDSVHASHADVTAMGRSLGSGVAVQLAAARPVRGLVLVTPFDSLVNLAKEYFRWLPVRLLLRDRFDSLRYVPDLSAPVLIVIAAEDEIVPMRRSRALADAFRPEQASVVVIEGVGHNTLDLAPDYLRAVGSFLDARLPGRNP